MGSLGNGDLFEFAVAAGNRASPTLGGLASPAPKRKKPGRCQVLIGRNPSLHLTSGAREPNNSIKADPQPVTQHPPGAWQPLGPQARGLGPVHALLLAGVHRVAHRLVDPHSDRLIWLYDIHRLAERFTAAEWQQLLALATERALCGPCLAGLSTAQSWFGTRLPEESLNRLRAGAAREAFDPGQPRQPWRMEWLEVRGLPSLAARWRWLGQRLFPDGAYLREQYGFHSALWLPWFYGIRIGRGILLRLIGRRPGPPARRCGVRSNQT